MGMGFWILGGLMAIGALAFWHNMRLWSVTIVGFNVIFATLFAIGLFEMVANILDGFMAVTMFYNDMIAFAVIDAILFFLLVYGHAATVLPADAVVSTGETLTEAETAALNAGVSVAQAVGIGKSIMLAAVAPLMLLYSYTSEPKRKIVSTLIPVGGILVIVLIILEAIRLGAGLIVGENKIDLVAFRQWLKQLTAQ